MRNPVVARRASLTATTSEKKREIHDEISTLSEFHGETSTKQIVQQRS